MSRTSRTSFLYAPALDGPKRQHLRYSRALGLVLWIGLLLVLVRLGAAS